MSFEFDFAFSIALALMFLIIIIVQLYAFYNIGKHRQNNIVTMILMECVAIMVFLVAFPQWYDLIRTLLNLT